MVLHALRTNDLWFINSGHPLDVPEIPTPISLGVVAGVLALTTAASLYRTRGSASAQCEEREPPG
jgi:tellurite resistance protein TerC